MKIALGSDHRGGRIAYRLVKDIFLRDHYSRKNVDSLDGEKMVVGAYLLEDANVSDVFREDKQNGDPAKDREKLYKLEYNKEPLPLEEFPEIAQTQGAPVCVDYPDVAAAVAQAVSEGRADRGVLICGTGIGMCVVANKFKNVRAALCYNEVAAELSRQHNNANILCVSGEFLSEAALESLVRKWFEVEFQGDRHVRRLSLISDIENGKYQPPQI